MSKGRLLLDEKGARNPLKTRRRIVTTRLKGGLLLISVALFSLGFIVYKPEYLVFLVLTVPALLFGVQLVRESRRANRVIGDLRIYENGILLHWRTLEQARKNEENFVPFSDIDELYMNPSLGYVTLRGSRIGRLEIEKDFVSDMLHFEEILGDLVKIKRSTERLLDEERWYVYCLARK
jgi:hypothetical protein